MDLTGNALDGVQIPRRRGREPCLDDVDSEPRQLPGDLQLLIGVQRGSWRLLAIPQSRIKDDDVIPIHAVALL